MQRGTFGIFRSPNRGRSVALPPSSCKLAKCILTALIGTTCSTARFEQAKLNIMSVEYYTSCVHTTCLTQLTSPASSHDLSVDCYDDDHRKNEWESDMFELMLHEGYIGRCLDGSSADRLQPPFAHRTAMPHPPPLSGVRHHLEAHATAASYCGDCGEYTR